VKFKWFENWINANNRGMRKKKGKIHIFGLASSEFKLELSCKRKCYPGLILYGSI
jgi:hypothetical protein